MRVYLKFLKLFLVLTVGIFFLVGSGENSGSTETAINDPIEPSAIEGALEGDEEDFFITKWKTDNVGISNDNQIEILTVEALSYNYDIDWGDGTINRDVNNSIRHTYTKRGTYMVKIMGKFPHIISSTVYNTTSKQFGDPLKLVSIEQWGNIEWESMSYSFMGCSNMVGNFTDTPNLSHVESMNSMFAKAELFNQNIGDWNTSTVKDISFMFDGAKNFNQDIGSWDVSNVTTMRSTFNEAENFNQDIGDWNVSNVRDMAVMFQFAENFNQNIGKWDVSNVHDMSYMFQRADIFNQDIGDWNVSNVDDMSSMFHLTTLFNQNIGDWNVSNVDRMPYMFDSALSFNKDIGKWDVSHVLYMSNMFNGAGEFNQDIGDWNVSFVQDMDYMFADAYSFSHQNLSLWNVSEIRSHDGFSDGWGEGNIEPNWNE